MAHTSVEQDSGPAEVRRAGRGFWEPGPEAGEAHSGLFEAERQARLAEDWQEPALAAELVGERFGKLGTLGRERFGGRR